MTDYDMRDAACKEVDPELWQPERGGSSPLGRRKETEQAIAICQTCPVRVPCLEAAMAEEADESWRWGIRGGLTARERTKLAMALEAVA